MKQVLFWKRLDIVGQGVMLLPLMAIVSPVSRNYAMLCYLSVGAWQLLSIVIHALFVPLPAGAERRRYGIVLSWIFGVFGVACLMCWLCSSQHDANTAIGRLREVFLGIAVIEGMLMLFIGPVLAYWYARITLDEINAIRHRAEIHWKL